MLKLVPHSFWTSVVKPLRLLVLGVALFAWVVLLIVFLLVNYRTYRIFSMETFFPCGRL